MQTAFRFTQKVNTDEIVITFPEIRKLLGREVEIIVFIDGELEDSTVPPRALQNSRHVAGSVVLDEEAMQQIMENRFR